GASVAELLLAIHRSYFEAVFPVRSALHGIAHITGGGIPGNLIRVLPEGCAAVVSAESWSWPPLFRILREAGKLSLEEMRAVFNLGIGLVAVLSPEQVAGAQEAAGRAGVSSRLIGEVVAGERSVRFA